MMGKSVDTLGVLGDQVRGVGHDKLHSTNSKKNNKYCCKLRVHMCTITTKKMSTVSFVAPLPSPHTHSFLSLVLVVVVVVEGEWAVSVMV